MFAAILQQKKHLDLAMGVLGCLLLLIRKFTAPALFCLLHQPQL